MKFVRNSKSQTNTEFSARLGELLLAANLVREDVLSEALQIAERSKTKIGQTLVGLGQIDEKKLQAALEVQALIRNHTISTEFGLRALSLACSTKVPVQEALTQLGWKPQVKSTVPDSGLVAFIRQSGVVTPVVLEQAQKQSKETNRPLGQCLVLNRTITQTILSALLSAQVLIKEGKISQDQAIQAVQSSLKQHQTLERSLFELGIKDLAEAGMRIGDLLSAAGLLTDGDRLNALETALIHNKQIGETLVELQMIPRNTLENALKLQNLIRSGYISVQLAANFLKRFQAQDLSEEAVTFAIEGKGKDASRLEQVLDLLLKTNVLSKETVEEGKKTAEAEKKSLGEILLSQCKIDPHYLEAAWGAQRMIDDKIITSDQAAHLLLKISDSGLTFEQALEQTLKRSEPSVQNIRQKTATTISQTTMPSAVSSAKTGWLHNLLSKIKKSS